MSTFKIQNKSFLFFAIIALFGTSSLTAQFYYPPKTGGNWDTLSETRFGYCKLQIDSLYAFLDQTNTKSFTLLIDGKIVLEKYFDKFTKDSSWYWASAGKTMTAALMGIAKQENKVDFSDKTSKYLGTGWTSLSAKREDSITVWHQLTMTTGLNDRGANADCTDPSCLDYKAAAGTRWAYHNAPYTLLDGVLSNATGVSINNYFLSKIGLKTGMGGLYVKLDYNNVFFSTTRNMSRFGLLLLSKGMWDGASVIDSNYVKTMSTSSQTLNPSYGYLTWLNGKSSFMVPGVQFSFQGSLNPSAPNDVFMALGKNAQLINVVPSKKMVWVRMGDSPEEKNELVSPLYNEEIWKRINALKCAQNSLQEVQKTQISSFPNPVKKGSKMSILGIPMEGKMISMSSVDGRKVLSLPVQNNSIEIPQHLASGMYLLGNAQTGFIKVIVE